MIPSSMKQTNNTKNIFIYKEYLRKNQLSCSDRNRMKPVGLTLKPPKPAMNRIKVF